MFQLDERTRTLRILYCAVAAVILASGCTNDSDKDAPKAGSKVRASAVCGGILDAPAAAALQRVSGTNRFNEAVRENSTGKAETFSADLAASQLYRGYGDRDTCSVYNPDDNSGHPLFTIEFLAIDWNPSTPHKETGEKWVLYPMGAYTRAGELGADIYFHCPTKAPAGAETGDAEYAKAEMYAPVATLRGEHPNADRMTILNSAARAVAKAAGCADEAALPAKVPAPKTG